MKENTKKAVMIVIIVACFTLAGIRIYTIRPGRSSGGGAINPSSTVWLKCDNPACGNEFQMQEKEYLNLIKEKLVPGIDVLPPITCPRCSQESAHRAIKCERCGKVFFPNTVQSKFDDICPGCGFSKLEEKGKEAAAAASPSE